MDISKIRMENRNYDIKDEVSRNKINELNSEIEKLKNSDNTSIIISDSYFNWTPDENDLPDEKTYWYKFFKMAGIKKYYAYCKGGIGFYQKVDNKNFQAILEDNFNNIPNKETIKNIFVFGGYNDSWKNETSIYDINDAINNFVAYCKQHYPNAKIYIGEIGYDTRKTVEGSRRRNNINAKVIPAYANTSYNINFPYIYLPNLNYCLHNSDFMASDGIHPSSKGHNELANAVFSAYNNGYYQQTISEEYVDCTPAIENSRVDVQFYVTNKIPIKTIRINRFEINFDNNNLQKISHNNSLIVAKFTNSNLLIPTYKITFKRTALFCDNNNNYTVCPISLEFSADNVLIKSELLSDDKHNWKELTNIKYIEIMQDELVASMDVL